MPSPLFGKYTSNQTPVPDILPYMAHIADINSKNVAHIFDTIAKGVEEYQKQDTYDKMQQAMSGSASTKDINTVLAKYAEKVDPTKTINQNANDAYIDYQKNIKDSNEVAKSRNAELTPVLDETAFKANWLKSAENLVKNSKSINPDLQWTLLKQFEVERNKSTPWSEDDDVNAERVLDEDYYGNTASSEIAKGLVAYAEKNNPKLPSYANFSDINKEVVSDIGNGVLKTNKAYDKLPDNKINYTSSWKIKEEAAKLGLWDEKKLLEAQHQDNAIENNGKVQGGSASQYVNKRPNENQLYDELTQKIIAEKDKQGVDKRKALLADPEVQKKIEAYAKGDFGEAGIPSEATDLATQLGFNREDYGMDKPAPLLYRDSKGNLTFFRDSSEDYSGVKTISENIPFGLAAAIPFTTPQYGNLVKKLPPALTDFFSRIKEGKVDKNTAMVDVGKPKSAEQTPVTNRATPVWESIAKTNQASASTGVVKSDGTKLKTLADKQKADLESGISFNKKEATAVGAEFDAMTLIQKQQMDRTERKESTRAYYEKTFGRVPYNFDKLFDEQSPEPNVVSSNGREFIKEKDGNWKELSARKTVSQEDISKEKAFSFGLTDKSGRRLRDENGNYMPQELSTGSGIYAAGAITGDQKTVGEIRQDAINGAEALNLLRSKVLPLFDKGGVTLSPKEAAKYSPVFAKLKQLMRPSVIGQGAVSDWEQQELAKGTPNPTSLIQHIMTMGGERGKAEELMKLMEENLQNIAIRGEFNLVDKGKKADVQTTTLGKIANQQRR